MLRHADNYSSSIVGFPDAADFFKVLWIRERYYYFVIGPRQITTLPRGQRYVLSDGFYFNCATVATTTARAAARKAATNATKKTTASTRTTAAT